MKQVGDRAEAQAAAYLETRGFRILARNWRTRYCEIDIVASRQAVVYFVEVKYRSRSDWGEALGYVTPKKLRQMQFAAQLWLVRHGWQGDSQLAVVAIDDRQLQLMKIGP